MTITKDTPVPQAENTHPSDPHQIGSGKSTSPGGADSTHQNQHDLTFGAENDPKQSPADDHEANKPQSAGVPK